MPDVSLLESSLESSPESSQRISVASVTWPEIVPPAARLIVSILPSKEPTVPAFSLPSSTPSPSVSSSVGSSPTATSLPSLSPSLSVSALRGLVPSPELAEVRRWSASWSRFVCLTLSESLCRFSQRPGSDRGCDPWRRRGSAEREWRRRRAPSRSPVGSCGMGWYWSVGGSSVLLRRPACRTLSRGRSPGRFADGRVCVVGIKNPEPRQGSRRAEHALVQTSAIRRVLPVPEHSVAFRVRLRGHPGARAAAVAAATGVAARPLVRGATA